MKIFIIDGFYQDFYDDFYANPELLQLPYRDQKKRMLERGFGTADFFSHNLNLLGCAAEEFIITDERGQKTWAKEHAVSYRRAYFQNIRRLKYYFRSHWLDKILEAQINEFRPDIIFSGVIKHTNVAILTRAKKKFKCPVIGQIASALPPRERFAPYDLLISSLPHYIETFRKWGKRAEYMPLAFEPTILSKIRQNGTPYECVHIGGYGKIHEERNKILEEVTLMLQPSGKQIDCWGYDIDRLPTESPLRQHYHGHSWGLERCRIFAHSKIVVTKHISDVASRFANNLTLFEATGSGALLLTDWKENLPTLFEIGTEIETYDNPSALAEKITYYLEHEQKRQSIALSGQKRTLSEHTWHHRMQRLVTLIKSL